MRLSRSILSFFAVLGVVLGLGLSSPAMAQQNAPINPTASSVREDQLLNALKPGSAAEIGGRISIPDGKAATLIRPAGREWREFHQGTMHLVGAVAILGMLAVLVGFYLKRGKIMISGGPAGSTITRFGAFDRFIHWTTAGCFIVLALSGLNITFGKVLLMPIIGEVGFAAMAQLGKYAHNYLAFPFMIGLALMFLVWVKDNIPGMIDLQWFAMGGGLIGKGHPKAKRFNGGQKMVFWSVILGGAALSVSGWYLLFPYTAGGVLNLQFWNVVHGIVGVVLIGAMLAHAYIGSIGMEGAFDAMGSGEVDLNWAREHHSLWVEDEMKKGVVPARLQAAE
ncbi:MAG: formate dehydrogenase subunit gamma [Hyphomicrobiales bacterium]|nr:formate dehydrogenase subunit gamma [Hyphomicrobiales bacterium]